MNTLSRLDTYVASYLLPSSSIRPPASPSSEGSVPTSPNAPGPSSRLSDLPPTPRKARRRRHKPTTSSIKLPPPTTPLLLRVLLGLWSILLSLWTSLVVETRAERVKRRRKPRPNLLRQLSEAVTAVGGDAVEAEIELGSEGEGSGEGEAEGSASEIEGGLASDDDWTDPVTRAPVDDKVDEPTDDEFSLNLPPPTPLPLLSQSSASRQTDEKFSFRLRSAEGRALVPPPNTPPPVPRTFVQQPTPPGILANPLSHRVLDSKQPSYQQNEDTAAVRKSPRKSGLLPNPIATNVLDPTVPAVPSSQTFSVASTSVPPPRKHTTPFHLQKTLILDLDETLIHSTSRPISYAASSGGGLLGLSGGLLGGRGKRREGHAVEVVLHGRSTMYHVYKRPHVDYFLKKVASWYTLVIYTASMPEYADPVIDWLDAGRGLFARKLYRESCHLQPNGSYIKDLALVEADLSRVCFMDNSPISYSWNKANALPIEGWTSDPNDEALLHSIPVLDSLRFVNDVRRVLGIRGFS